MCVVGRPTESSSLSYLVYSMGRAVRFRSIERNRQHVLGHMSGISRRYMHAEKITSTVEVRQPSNQWYNMIGFVPYIPQRGL